MRRLLVLTLSLFIVTSLRAQEPEVDVDSIAIEPNWKPKAFAKLKEVKDKKVAVEHLKTFKTAFKSKDRKQRIAAIEALLKTGRHEVYVTSLAKALKDRSVPVRVAAARGLARLGYEKGAAYLNTAFRSPQNRKQAEVRVAALDALGRIKTKRSYFKTYRKVFSADDADDMRAAALLFGHAKDRKALPLLGKWLASPRPSNQDSAANPPASFWKKKYETWSQVKREVEWAVWSITGRVLETPQEVRDWIEEDAKRRKKAKKKSSGKKVRR